MPQVGTRVKVTGDKRTIAKLARMKDRVRAAIQNVIKTYTLLISAQAVRNAPGDTGRLRGSMSIVVRRLLGKVAFTADYAAFVEFGTGPLGSQTYKGDLPEEYSHGSSHDLPPADALEGWANRHDANPWQVAQAIRSRGGNPAQSFLGPAYEQHIDDFRRNLRRVIRVAIGELAIG